MLQHTPTSRKQFLRTIVLVTCVLLGGCDKKKAQIETRIEPDGKFYRKLVIPINDSLPPEALVKAKKYPPSTQPTDYKLQPDWLKKWNAPENKSVPSDAQEGTYIEIAGQFATADQIPRHYHLIAYPFEDRASTNRIEHSYEDYSLFGIDDWTETITETISLPEYTAAVDEVVAKMTPVIEAALDEIFEQEYDLRDLHPYLRTQLASAFKKFALWMYQLGPNFDNGDLSPDQLQQIKQILADIGFDLPLNEDGDEVDEEKAEAALQSFFQNLFQTRIRSRSTGELLTAEQAKALMKLLEISPDEGGEHQQESSVNMIPPSTAPASSPSSTPAEKDIEKKLNQFDQILAYHFEKTHHVPLEETALTWGAKMGGAHRKSFLCLFDPACKFFDDRVFNYVLRTPGPILETDGKRLGSQAVIWIFSPSDTWPCGHKMHATAIRWNREAEQKLFGRVVLNDLDTALQVRASLDEHEALRDALRKCVDVGDLKPLEALSSSTNEQEREAAKTILELRDNQ